ncbi:Stress responsive A/B Barrel Domain protein [Marinomonas spartinae]|uniref:Stress responsive A/B Barrel Domain protein n=1 Tax=Marinomonas spartinae TaxID=1792290 RepID=A0A1A8TQR3_9GAMM|nr:Dabb family protein [Marinomonas spartinae]SBS36746.1 Stress responsive A/B Barrel Domain protein [Marinomonas spartinae]SBS38668.1 Stress responsive A/B Barrel Domain protein [Marinomonas spartinae]
MLQHYVFIKYQEGTSDEHIHAFKDKMLMLKRTIKEIKHIEVSIDELHEERSWDVVLNMQFSSLEDLRTYQAHPDHVAVMQFNGPNVAHVGALDCHI